MRNARILGWLSRIILTAQVATIGPQVRSKPTADHKITTIELTAHFVTTIRVPEPVNSVVVGDPALFQIEHSEREPELVFVNALTTEDAESNLPLSTAKERQLSFQLVSHGRANAAKVDFLLRCQTAGSFLIEPEAVPSPVVAQTTSMSTAQSPNMGRITDRFVGQYNIRLLKERRSEFNPSGLLVADDSEKQMVGERDNGLEQRSELDK
jgi:Flp pilus assembly secretin CpaC